jgi:branched-chain amino acid transport system substrate-binding protein
MLAAAFPLVATAAKAAGSTKAAAVAKELVNTAVLKRAQTAMLAHYHYTAASHAPHATGDSFDFIPPSVIVDGQWGHRG